MNIYEFFTRLTHPMKRIGWIETTAYFTGEYRIPHRGRGGYYPKMINTLSTNEFHEYGVKYYVDDKERIGWYLFYPGEDPDPEEIKGTSMRIRYMKRRPWISENIDSL